MCDSRPVSFGWQYEFRQRDWTEVRDVLAGVEWRDQEPEYLFRIIDSVVDAGGDELLAVTTSMHDLVIAPLPIEDPPFDVVLVAAPGSARIHPAGTVRIDYQGVNGRSTELVRPAAEALSLLWRFMEVEFGIRQTKPR